MRIFSVLAVILTFSFNTFAATPSAVSASDRKALLKTVSADVMIHAATEQARKFGETCKSNLLSAVVDDGGAIAFEVTVDCSEPANNETGGGTVLMIDVKGRSFGTLLDNLTITVNKAG